MKAHNSMQAETLSSGEGKTERKFRVFTESFFSLSFDLGGLIAGSLIGYYATLIFLKSWAIAIYPIVLTGRGALNGVLAGRLSTGLHVELIKPSLTKNTRYYYAVASSLLSLSLIVSFIMSTMAFIVTGALLSELPLIFSTCITAQAITMLLTVPATSMIGFIAFKRGLDPDAILYPISSTLADIWATISYLIALYMAFWLPVGQTIIYIIGIATIIFAGALTYIFSKESEYWRTLREASLTIVVVTLIATVSGYSLSHIKSRLEASPEILIVYPALIDTLGDSVAIFGSISTTKLFIGTLESKLSHLTTQVRDLAQLWLSSTIYYIVYGFIAYLPRKNIISFLLPLASFNLIFPVMITIAFIIAILTFKKGLDPDNFVIPFETALTDALMTLTLTSLVILFYAA